jgi:hypothetical protein
VATGRPFAASSSSCSDADLVLRSQWHARVNCTLRSQAFTEPELSRVVTNVTSFQRLEDCPRFSLPRRLMTGAETSRTHSVLRPQPPDET